jgi:hypothetical protein
MPAIEKGYRKNFEALLWAAKNGGLALTDCWDTVENKPVRMLTAISVIDGGEYLMAPLAVMVDCDPYERYLPPGYDMQQENKDEGNT